MKRQELKALLRSLSPEEKVMQLVQLPGSAYEADAARTGLTAEEEAPLRALAGSTLGLWGAEKLRAIQKTHMARHPHHIPLLFMLDVIHGHRTVFPCPLGLSAAFDPALAEEAAAVQAREAAADGVHVTFSPMADLVRDARWGRVMESAGEDPFLSGEMAAALVRGYQGRDVGDPAHIAACVKHFAAYGAAEAGRDYQNAELSEHTLREQYLPAYRRAVDAGAKMVMSSFNTWNGIPSTGSRRLLRNILRQEFGFDGVVISDWGAVGELVNHGYAADLREAAKRAMEAGVDIDMCSGAYQTELPELVRSGALPESMLDEAVLRVLNLKNELGLFEDPFRGIPADTAEKVLLAPAHRALARRAAAESLVLLENQNETLPLRGKKIALIGPYADCTALHSAWALSADPADTVTVRQGLEAAFAGTGVCLRSARGCTMLDQDTVLNSGVWHEDDWEAENERLLREAAGLADWADVTVLCLGEDRRLSGECASRTRLSLPDVQLRLLRTLRARNAKLAVLVFGGRPLELAEVRTLSDVLLLCWLPGTEGGNGIADVLTGRRAPSGKLSMSFPRSVGQEPLHYNVYSTGRPKPESGPADFTSRYLDSSNEPLYPFGYGLSYTDFEISEPALDADTLRPGETLTATAEVRNTGSAAAELTVQLYIGDVSGSRVRPVRELKAFQRIALAPGEARSVRFRITEEMLRFWTENERMESEAGLFRLWIGADSRETRRASFVLVK